MRAGVQEVIDFLDVYAYDICMEFELPRPETQHTRDRMPLDLVLSCCVVPMFRVTDPDLAHGQAKQLF